MTGKKVGNVTVDNDRQFAFKKAMIKFLEEWGVTLYATDEYNEFDEDGGSICSGTEVRFESNDGEIDFLAQNLYKDHE